MTTIPKLASPVLLLLVTGCGVSGASEQTPAECFAANARRPADLPPRTKMVRLNYRFSSAGIGGAFLASRPLGQTPFIVDSSQTQTPAFIDEWLTENPNVSLRPRPVYFTNPKRFLVMGAAIAPEAALSELKQVCALVRTGLALHQVTWHQMTR